MSETTSLRDTLLYQKKNGYDALSPAEIVTMNDYCEDYKAYLDAGKTEREACREAVRLAEAAGFVAYTGQELKPGDRVYAVNNDRYCILMIAGAAPLSEGFRLSVAHIDSPRLDLKSVPVYEDSDLCMLKTHYYGGIRKYQWVATPLAMHGTVTLRDGSSVEICIGEDAGDPVFTITDLLPHLAQEQGRKPLSEAYTGENLNVLAGSLPYADEDSDRIRMTFLSLLHSTYGITERDLITAEISLVPAGCARDVGLDRSLIGAYGQDDRVCGYAALRALLEQSGTPENNLICILADKEEIGSEGISGMQSQFFDAFVRRVCHAAGICADGCIAKSLCLSADVAAAYDPNFSEAFEKRNSALANCGVALVKFTGARGKSGSSDASSELFARIAAIMDEAGVIWQSGELGRVDLGGGGTVAKFVANRNIPTIDVGTPVLSMHAPFEVTGKLDCYMTFKAFDAFNRAK